MLLSVTFCDGQVSGEAKYLVGDSSLQVRTCKRDVLYGDIDGACVRPECLVRRALGLHSAPGLKVWIKVCGM